MLINVKIPGYAIRTIADITKSALDAYRAINKTISELPVISEEMDGKRAVERRQKVLEEFEAQKEHLLNEARTMIKPLIERCTEIIDRQTTPSGDLITENSDFILLDRGYIKSPDQLKRLIDKHLNTSHGILFAMIAEDYALKRDWGSDFRLMTDEGIVREFCENIADVCQKALQFPGGYFDAYASDDKFVEKVASAHGVLESFEASVYGGFPEESEPESDDPSGDDSEPSGGDDSGGDNSDGDESNNSGEE